MKMKNEWNDNLNLKSFKKRKKKQERARILDESDKKVNQMNQEIKKMIQIMLSNGMSLEFVSKSLSKSEDEILDLLK